MNKILTILVVSLISFSALAAHHNSVDAEVHDAIKAFNIAYASNDLDAYFGFYADDATIYFYGERHKVSAYREEWTAEIDAGVGVEKNETSDVRVQMMPSGDVAVVTSFIDNRTRGTDGETTTVRAFETEVWQKIDDKWKVISLHYTEIPSAN
jgi:ketosteroid isomerase-like protein